MQIAPLSSVRTDTRSSLASVIATTSLGFVLVQLDVSIVNLALARMGNALGASVSGLQWIADAYTIAFASLLLTAGSAGDRFGQRRVFEAGFALFALASLGCGFAPGLVSLIAARVLEGAGAALLVPCSLALLRHETGGNAAARVRAIALWTAAGSAALAAGPIVGGVLVQSVGWRAIFLVNVPLGAVGICCARRFLTETTPEPTGFDAAGQALAFLTLLSLVGAAIEAGPLGPAHPLVLSGFMLAAVGAGAFLRVERRAARPFLPPGFFRHASFRGCSLIGLVVNAALYGALFVIGLCLQRVFSFSPSEAGLALLPFAIALGLGNLAAARLAGRYGAPATMAAGLLLGAAGFWLLRGASGAEAYTALLPGLIAIPAGIGLVVPLMTSVLLASVSPGRAGVAAGVLNTVRQAGGSLGIASAGSFFAAAGMNGMRATFAGFAALLAMASLFAFFGLSAEES